MTQGEKMIWAAVFASDYIRAMNPPSDVGFRTPCSTPDRIEEEKEKVHSTVEAACHAVEYLREQAPDIKEGFDGVTNVYSMLEDMLNITNIEKGTCEPNCKCGKND